MSKTNGSEGNPVGDGSKKHLRWFHPCSSAQLNTRETFLLKSSNLILELSKNVILFKAKWLRRLRAWRSCWIGPLNFFIGWRPLQLQTTAPLFTTLNNLRYFCSFFLPKSWPRQITLTVKSAAGCSLFLLTSWNLLKTFYGLCTLSGNCMFPPD